MLHVSPPPRRSDTSLLRAQRPVANVQLRSVSRGGGGIPKYTPAAHVSQDEPDVVVAERYPNNGPVRMLQKLAKRMKDDPTCDQQCRRALRRNAREQFEQDVRTKDRRMTRKQNIDELQGLRRAVYCVNRARQMAGASFSFLQNNKRRQAGEAMLFGRVTFPLGVQQPNTRRKPRISACALMYEAYKLVREYETSPPPPLVNVNADILPNPERIEQDMLYNMLVGCVRMTPNRLGIGPEARDVWMQHGFLDPNFAPTQNVDARNEAGAQLYGNVAGDALFGPVWVYAYYKSVEHSLHLPPLAPHPVGMPVNYVDEFQNAPFLQQLVPGLQARDYETDAGRALIDIHIHMPQALNVLPVLVGGNASQPPPPLQHAVTAPEPEIQVPGTNRTAVYYPQTVPVDGSNARDRVHVPLDVVRSLNASEQKRLDFSSAGLWSCRDAVMKLVVS